MRARNPRMLLDIGGMQSNSLTFKESTIHGTLEDKTDYLKKGTILNSRNNSEFQKNINQRMKWRFRFRCCMQFFVPNRVN